MKKQIAIRTVLMRGGSSKAVFVREEDIPADEKARSRFLLALFGSPDRRQIDGLGGAEVESAQKHRQPAKQHPFGLGQSRM